MCTWVRFFVSSHSVTSFVPSVHFWKSWILKKVVFLFKGCWQISTSRRMQTKYASSQGKAKFLLWTSLKPSHQWLSWGDWHCHYFWQRTAGNCTWEPGCTGRCWAGCGWTFLLSEQGQRLPQWDAQKTWRDCAIFLHPIKERCAPDAQQCVVRGSEIYPARLVQCWSQAESWTKVQRNAKLFALLVPLCDLGLQPETMRERWVDLLKSISINEKKSIIS